MIISQKAFGNIATQYQHKPKVTTKMVESMVSTAILNQGDYVYDGEKNAC